MTAFFEYFFKAFEDVRDLSGLRIAAVGLCMLGILGSHYVLLIHKVWSIAVPMPVRLALLPFAPFARAAFEP